MKYRAGNIQDVTQMRALALKSWSEFQNDLTDENWQKLSSSLGKTETYLELVENSDSIVCENANGEIVGMAFLVRSGNPTEIYPPDWCYIRLLSVDPEFRAKGVGRELTKRCLEIAANNKEKTVALHTSEMMSKARNIYESLGFSVFKEIEPRLGKRYWLFKLELDLQ